MMPIDRVGCSLPRDGSGRPRLAHHFAALLCALTFVACGRATRPVDQPVPGAPPVREGYLTGTDGARLFYRVVGRGVDTVIVVHGGPGAGMQAVYPDLLPLADGRVLLFYDQRGGGRSELPADTSRLGPLEHVQDLEAVRRHFALDRMTVVAHSFGAVVVAKYLEAHPERVARLVFVGATGPRQAEAEGYYRALVTGADTVLLKRRFGAMMALMQGTAADVLASCRELAETGRALSTARGEPSRWKGSECDMPADALRYYFRYTARLGPALFGSWDFTRSLRAARAPLLVVYGELDVPGVAMQRAWARSLPDARLLLVPGAGKGAPADRPAVVLPAIDRFLRGEWPTAAQAIAE